jgi:hypothetical protein
MKVPESGGTCEGCGATWKPDERGTLQRTDSAATVYPTLVLKVVRWKEADSAE